MEIASGILSMLLSLAVPVAAIVLIVRAVRGRHGTAGSESAGVLVRRFFHYALLYGLLIVVAIGVADLIRVALPEDGLLGRSSEVLARALAFVVVGGPAVFGLATWARRRLVADPTESGSLAWNAYLTVTSITALAVTVGATIGVLRWAFGVDDFDAGALSNLIVWAAVWAAHWMVASRWASKTLMRLHTLVGSAIGLGVAAVGVGMTLAAAFGSAYERIANVVLVDSLWESLGEGLAVAVTGALAWWWYWLRHELEGERTALWDAYVVLLGILPGLVTAGVAVSTSLYTALVWWFGDPGVVRAAVHFDELPASLAAAAVGGALWVYHRTVLGPVRLRSRSEIDRVYDYVVAGAGLIAATAGIAIVFIALFEAIAPDSVAEAGGASNTLMAAITALAVGAPLWWRFWAPAQRLAAADDAEVASTTRRVYLFALFGVGGVVAVISLIVLLVTTFEAILEGTVDSETLYDNRIALAIIVTLGAVAAYHWSVYRAERGRIPTPPTRAVERIIVVGPDDPTLARTLASRTGATVQTLHRLDVEPVPLEIESITSAVLAADAKLVMVIADHDHVEVVPVETTSNGHRAAALPS